MPDKLGNDWFNLVIPEAYQLSLLRHFHDSLVGGHLGVTKTLTRLQTRYYWVDMQSSVSQYIKTCVTCQRKKNPPKSYCAPMQKYVLGVPFERVALDIMGPLPETKQRNSYILVITDYFSRWIEAFAMPNMTAETVARVLFSE